MNGRDGGMKGAMDPRLAWPDLLARGPRPQPWLQPMPQALAPVPAPAPALAPAPASAPAPAPGAGRHTPWALDPLAKPLGPMPLAGPGPVPPAKDQACSGKALLSFKVPSYFGARPC